MAIKRTTLVPRCRNQQNYFLLSLTILGAGLALVFASKQHRWGVFLSMVGLALLGIDTRDAISSLLVVSVGRSPLALTGTGLVFGLLTAAMGYLLLRTGPRTIDRPVVAPERNWASMSKAQIAGLRNRFAAMPPTVEQRDNRHISIAREEFPDCANLADDIAEAFKDAGWVLIHGGPIKIRGTISYGIWISGPPNDPRKPPLLTALSEVLGSNYEPMRLDTALSWLPGLDEAMAIRISIGRSPQRN
jgi:hypothetical protein